MVVLLVLLMTLLPGEDPVATVSAFSSVTTITRKRAAPPCSALWAGRVDSNDVNWQEVANQVWNEVKDICVSLGTAAKPLFASDDSVTPEAIVAVCDELDALSLTISAKKDDDEAFAQPRLWVRQRVSNFNATNSWRK